MAALIAAATEAPPTCRSIAIESDGVDVDLRQGRARARGGAAAGGSSRHHRPAHARRGRHAAARDRVSRRARDNPQRQGRARRFRADGRRLRHAAALLARRIEFGAPQDGAVSRCDIVLDLSGGTPLFPSADLRDGYLRADPGDPAAVLRAVLKARDLTGTFEKPRYIDFTARLCAHRRSKIVGCHRCLDLCPTGAIAPDGDHVAIDAAICAGCGQCAAACPTGAAAYALPPSDALLRAAHAARRLRQAGGARAIVLFHDGEHGAELIDALARYGDGLPANVLPVAVNEMTQVGLEAVAACFAYGARRCASSRARSRGTTSTGLHRTIALAEPILVGLGFAGPRVAHDRDRRSGCARRGLARDRRRWSARRARRHSCRSAASAN